MVPSSEYRSTSPVAGRSEVRIFGVGGSIFQDKVVRRGQINRRQVRELKLGMRQPGENPGQLQRVRGVWLSGPGM